MSTLFPEDRDLEGAREARDKAVEQVTENNLDWMSTVLPLALAWIRGKSQDDLFTTASLYGLGPQPREPRAWGGLMQRLRALGVIEPRGYTQVGLRKNHNRPMRLWRKK